MAEKTNYPGIFGSPPGMAHELVEEPGEQSLPSAAGDLPSTPRVSVTVLQLLARVDRLEAQLAASISTVSSGGATQANPEIQALAQEGINEVNEIVPAIQQITESDVKQTAFDAVTRVIDLFRNINELAGYEPNG